MSRRKRNPMQIFRADGKDSFMEVLGGMIDKGKIQINFVEYDPANGNKQKAIISTYIDLPLYMGLVEGILSGEFRHRVEDAKAKKMFEGATLTNYTSFFTSMGGVNEENVAKDFAKYKAQYEWLAEGQAVSRQFKVQSGMKYPYLLQGCISVGKSNAQGLIVPQGPAKKFINIGFSYDQMMALAATSKAFISAYYNQMVAKFVSENGAYPNQMSEYNFDFLKPPSKKD